MPRTFDPPVEKHCNRLCFTHKSDDRVNTEKYKNSTLIHFFIKNKTLCWYRIGIGLVLKKWYRCIPRYNSYTHSLKKETRNLERKWRKTTLEVFRIAWKNSMSSYRQALKVARTEHIRKPIDNKQNNPRFLFSTVARLTNKQISPDLNIASHFNSYDL